MIAAVVLAAGRSTRMGRPKMLMPWGEGSVIGHVVSVLQRADVPDIVVVTGADSAAVSAEVAGRDGVRIAFNADFDRSEMLGSIQCGLAAQLPQSRAALICLGDQPQILASSVERVCAAFLEGGAPLVVPSYERRRGHPWLIARPLWPALSSLRSPHTPRDFLNAHSADIFHVDLETSTIMQDLDTPEDHDLHSPARS